jgi:dienelactone hydrolase
VTRKTGLPPEDHVRAVMTRMLAAAAAGGPRPIVLALAGNLGLANATFWRHYHDIATELRQHAARDIPALARGQNPQPGQDRELASQNAALRRERDHLVSQLEAALSHLRRLTIDNAELRRELETARAITRIGRPDTADPG